MNRPFSLVLALREGRSGFRRIGWFLLAIALGVGVLTGLYGFQKDAAIGVRSEARELLGGDLRIQSNNALDERIDAVLDSLEASGVRVARGVSLASIVSVPETGASRLLQVNAVDPTFPAAGKEWEALFKATDEALYVSKRKGRNRVTVWTSGLTEGTWKPPAVA